jgi:amino-acid N-acetyltransferase
MENEVLRSEFRPAVPDDLPQIIKLLSQADLPLAGVENHVTSFLLAFRQGSLAGCAGVEQYGSVALLRSVAVDERERNTGLGQEIVRRMLDRLRAGGVEKVVLLTTTAANFFRRFGFRIINRADAPNAVRESLEFQEACPASAIVMHLELTTNEQIENTSSSSAERLERTATIIKQHANSGC